MIQARHFEIAISSLVVAMVLLIVAIFIWG